MWTTKRSATTSLGQQGKDSEPSTPTTTAALRTGLEKETQFSRKVELNMRIKKLEKNYLYE